MSLQKDRNFDNLIDRFEQSVYDTHKGNWRLKLLKEDLEFLRDASSPLSIWDAGCGLAQMSEWFARRGHCLTLCDISEKMLLRAEQLFRQSNFEATFIHESAQNLALKLGQFDLILFHAVLEWLAQPLFVLETVVRKVKPSGYLSLMFYNRNASVYIQTLKGGWRWQHLLTDSYLGKGKRLTPPNPQYPHEIMATLENNGFTIIKHTGIRVFHDYLAQNIREESNADELFELEYRYCRLPTYRDMGRYVHLVAQRRQEGNNALHRKSCLLMK